VDSQIITRNNSPDVDGGDVTEELHADCHLPNEADCGNSGFHLS
jgi:hypothetical protein